MKSIAILVDMEWLIDSCMMIILRLACTFLVPLSLFNVSQFRCMCQLPSKHCVVMQMVINHFCFLVRTTGWLVDKVCSARADVATSPFHKA